MNNAVIIVGGFQRDLHELLGAIPRGPRYFIVDEHTSDAVELPKADVAVYLFSRDTGFSSHLLSWFTWIHHQARPQREFVIGVGQVDLAATVFPFAARFPVITLEEFRKLLGLQAT